MIYRRLVLSGLLLPVLVLPVNAETSTGQVTTYPAADRTLLSADYKVTANGKEVAVYRARTLDEPFANKQWNFGGPYSFANFDMSGAVTLTITSTKSLTNTVLRPNHPDVRWTLADDHTLTITLTNPRKFSLEPDGKNGPLLLFANPTEVDVPNPDDPNVIFYGPGVHQIDRLDVTTGQTLYLAGGAVVKGAVVAEGNDIRIRGRGILDGSDYEWRKGPYHVTLGIHGTNVLVEGVTILGSSHWTIVPRDSRQVTIRNVKICNSRVQNDDGINPCNSQEVLITDCFIRSDDDCVAMKGLDFSAPNSNVEDIVVENSILWCDRARIFLLGHESRAPYMRNIVLRNLDIIHFTMTPFLFEPGEEMRLENVVIQDIRLHGEGQREFIRLKPVVNQYMRNKVPGHLKNIVFQNVELTGQPGEYRVHVEGADADHRVENVVFKNVSIQGEPLTRTSPSVTLGEHIDGIMLPKPRATVSSSYQNRVGKRGLRDPTHPTILKVGDTLHRTGAGNEEISVGSSKMKHSLFLSLVAGMITASASASTEASPTNQEGPFVFAYFNTGGSGQSQGLQLAYSRDGYSWNKITSPGGRFLEPKVGGKLMRDPSIVQGPDGMFHLVWTTDWWRQGIGIAHSRDLVDWSEQAYLDVMKNFPGYANCWAPEITYDRETKTYVIYWASTVPGKFPETEGHGKTFDQAPVEGVQSAHRMYVTTTQDFETYTATRLFFDDGYNCIDAFIVKDAPRDRYVMVIKDEELLPRAKKNIRVAYAASPLGPWSKSSSSISPDWVEGPALLRVGDEWLLYYDAYTRHRYEGLKTRDFEHWTSITDRLKMPDGMRHGTPFPVSEEILHGLLNAGASE